MAEEVRIDLGAAISIPLLREQFAKDLRDRAGIDINNMFRSGNAVAVPGSKMKIERILEDSDDWPLEDEGSIWGGTTYAYVAFSKTFDSSHATVPNASPSGALWAVANNDGAPGDVVALMADCIVRQAGGVGFGANIIARDHGVNAKLVGMEIDLEFSAAGSVGAGSGGLYINVFNKTNAGPAIQLGGLGGGKFTNGIILDAIVGTGLAPNGSASMTSMINSAGGVFSDAAIILSNTHRLKFNGTGAVNGYLSMDDDNNLRMTLGDAGFAIRDKTDNNTLFTFENSGALYVGAIKDQTSGLQVLAGRVTGFVTMEGSANQNGSAINVGTITANDANIRALAAHMKAVEDALISHGLIGA